MNGIVLLLGTIAAILPHWFPDEAVIVVLSPWIFLTCFLFVSRNQTARQPKLLWLAVWFVSFALRFGAFIGPEHIIAAIALSCLAAFLYAIPFKLDNWIRCYYQGPLTIFVFPIVYSTVDYFIEIADAGCLFAISYTQFDNKALLQIASVLGSKGITFVVALTASAIACVIQQKFLRSHDEQQPSRAVSVVAAISIVAVIIIHAVGFVRISSLTTVVESADTLNISWSGGGLENDDFLTTQEDSDDSDSYSEEDILAYSSRHLERSVQSAAATDTGLISFPEECFNITYDYEQELLDYASALAAENHICILLPIEVEDINDSSVKSTNKAVFIDSEGNILANYAKNKLIPLIEEADFIGGPDPLQFISTEIDGQSVNLSYAICFDGDFSSSIRTMNKDSEFLMVISWDWDEIENMHYRIVGLRAVENGLTVVKPTIAGYTTVTDLLGTIHSRTHSDDTGYDAIQCIDLPMASCITFYQSYGWLPDALYIVGTFIILVLIVREIRKKRTA